MSTEKRVKPPACDSCKARRVLCHSQPNGAPCPRCVEKGTVCTTTPLPRGRPKGRKTQRRLEPTATPSTACGSVSLQSSSNGSGSPPSLGVILRVESQFDPGFVAQVFEGVFGTPFNHPLISATSIQDDVRAASFQLNLLPPRARVLALCIAAVDSLISFHEAVLGPGPRPQSFGDLDFFSSDANVRQCGVRRATICRALHAETVKAAREADILLEPSSENAASCFLLDFLDQTNLYRLSRPWAGAYISHLRALAPLWRATRPLSMGEAAVWSAFVMAEALTSTEERMPILITRHDQMLLTGTDTPSLDALLASLTATEKPGLYVVWPAMQPYMVHVTSLARQLYETINGDLARLKPLSEPVVIKFLSALTTLHSVDSILLDRVAASIADIDLAHTPTPIRGVPPTIDSAARSCALAAVIGFAGLVLPFYHELEQRLPDEPRARERMRVFCAQARGFACEAAEELARVIRWLPGVQFPPTSYRVLYAWADFALGCAPEDTKDLEAITMELKLMAYSLDIYADPQVVSLIDRIDAYVAAKANGGSVQADSQADVENLLDPTGLPDLFFPGDYRWYNLPGYDGTMVDAIEMITGP
ncbi:hypothetical protein C8F04DRAFT_1116436 [Mycena alexandri]|uniref:Zn(2)-C6 fungal-type domain-containing protein n=1 Tax=Mycena alexandri TaxID=1745969 RepID=A0AAD6WY07_9AGAR|nr:hypothetical protein C8F04DRAFT_1116436 [Mycena alexandri]